MTGTGAPADPVHAAALVQPLWAAVPPAARARYLRRAAQAVLDDLDGLAELLAAETGRPRTEAVLAELLPSVGGLHALADDGPASLADRRLGRPALLRGGRRATLVQAPLGVVAVRGRPESPWAEPVLEVAAALLAGNAGLLLPPAPRTGERAAAAFVRAGVPGELVAVVPEEPGGADRVVDAGEPPGPAAMLVLDGAPADAVVSGALWAAFAGAGRHPAAVGRLVVRGPADGLVERLVRGVRALRVGDPADPATEVGPLASREDVEAVAALVAEAEAAGARRLCGGPVDGADSYLAPVVLRNVPEGAGLLREAVPGPVLAVVEAATDEEAIARARGAAAASVWTGDRAHGERVARTLGADVAWVNEHGRAVPSVPVRLARHVAPRRLASRPAGLPGARRLPYDPDLVAARVAAARLLHGRERQRTATLRAGAPPLARTALRLAREVAHRSGPDG